MSSISLMELEARETPFKLKEQLMFNSEKIAKVVHQIKSYDPQSVMIVGRGSSDHAGVFAKYLIEIELGIPTFSAAPSVTSVYQKALKLDRVLVIVISQSGRSPDILAQVDMARESGAFCIALVNDEFSPLSEKVHEVLPLKAGIESSVAATKSYLATLFSLLHLVAKWSDNIELIQAIQEFPDKLNTAIEAESQLKFSHLKSVPNLIVLGRGLGFAIANEMALKLKEVCQIQAEAFSSAEFLHGPISLIENPFVLLDVSVQDESFSAHEAMINEVKKRGGKVIHLHQIIGDVHPRIAPLLILIRFYLDVEQIAQEMGLNPDEPKGLKKVTKTI